MDFGLWASIFIFLLILIEFFRLNNLQKKKKKKKRERERMDGFGPLSFSMFIFLPSVYLRDALFK